MIDELADSDLVETQIAPLRCKRRVFEPEKTENRGVKRKRLDLDQSMDQRGGEGFPLRATASAPERMPWCCMKCCIASSRPSSPSTRSPATLQRRVGAPDARRGVSAMNGAPTIVCRR